METFPPPLAPFPCKASNETAADTSQFPTPEICPESVYCHAVHSVHPPASAGGILEYLEIQSGMSLNR